MSACFIVSFNVVTRSDRQTAREAPFCETMHLIFKHISDENIFLPALKSLNVIVLESEKLYELYFLNYVVVCG
jgi:hypothetical protein